MRCDENHFGCLNGTVLKELKIVYENDRRMLKGRRTARGVRRGQKDNLFNDLPEGWFPYGGNLPNGEFAE